MIIAFKKNDVVYLGYDQYIRFEEAGHRFSAKENSKVVRKYNDALAGTIGLLALNNFMRTANWLMIEDEKLEYDKLLSNLLTCFRDRREIVNNSSIVIAYKDKLFLFRDGMDLFELDDFCVCGTGSNYAVGYLYMNFDKENDPEKLMRDTFNYTRERVTDIGKDIVMINTRDLEFVEVKKC